jgi:hypothetical protein
MSNKHVVCYSGGESSAVVAVEVARKHGPENVILLNHDMHFSVEHTDIKRFKQEVADYLGITMTVASRCNATQDQFDVCVEAGAFKVGNGSELCTARLKTEPFYDWLAANADPAHAIIYYGFDNTPKERDRMQRRTGILAAKGYRTDYPLVTWRDRTIHTAADIGIARPSTYDTFIHGNCIGCLKAGWQHWYIVYCTRPDIWLKGKWAEEEIGYAIHYNDDKPVYLEDMESRFAAMQAAGIPATEHVPQQRFWSQARKIIPIQDIQQRIDMPCDCHFA